MSNKIQHEIAYRQLILETLSEGVPASSRAGDMLEVFGKQISFDLTHEAGFPLFTGRRIFIQGVVGELAAFLQGATHVSAFQTLGCNYWNTFADENGNLGPVYGAQWRDWDGHDQLMALVDLMKTNPTSRRMVVNAWNVTAMSEMCLPPCHYTFQVNVDHNHFDLLVSMRSLDLMLGFPSDVLLYALLMKVLANDTGLMPRRLIFSIGSCHIYAVHGEASREYLGRPLIEGPDFVRVDGGIDSFMPSSVSVVNYRPCEPIYLELLT
jgi:thymidylate synthase